MLLREISPGSTPPVVPTRMTRSLMGGIGGANFSETVLEAVNYLAEFDHCTLFEFHGEEAPAVVGISSWEPSNRVARSTEAYLGRFHHMEPVRALLHEEGERVFLRYHHSGEIRDTEFRRSCYESAAILDRLSIVASTRPGSWFVVNMFRDAAHGVLPEAQLDAVAEHAFLVAMAARRHAQLRAATAATAAAPRWEILDAPAHLLSPRERQVCSLIVAGHSQSEIAAQLGILLSSVVTFRKRAYQKLDVSDARALRLKCLGGAARDLALQ